MGNYFLPCLAELRNAQNARNAHRWKVVEPQIGCSNGFEKVSQNISRHAASLRELETMILAYIGMVAHREHDLIQFSALELVQVLADTDLDTFLG